MESQAHNRVAHNNFRLRDKALMFGDSVQYRAFAQVQANEELAVMGPSSLLPWQFNERSKYLNHSLKE